MKNTENMSLHEMRQSFASFFKVAQTNNDATNFTDLLLNRNIIARLYIPNKKLDEYLGKYFKFLRKRVCPVYHKILRKQKYILLSRTPIVLTKKQEKLLFRDHRFTGLFLGYPKCCVEEFVKNYKEEKRKAPSYYPALAYLEKVKHLKKPNFKIGVFDDINVEMSHIAWIPCSNNCPESLKRRKEDIRETKKLFRLLKRLKVVLKNSENKSKRAVNGS